MAGPQSPQPSLRWELLIPGVLLAGVAAYGLYLTIGSQVAGIITPPKEEPPVAALAQPDDVKPRDYTHYGRPEAPPPVPPAPPPSPASRVPTAQYTNPEAAQAMMLAATMQQLQANTQAMQAQTGMIERALSALLPNQQQAPPAQAPAPVQPSAVGKSVETGKEKKPKTFGYLAQPQETSEMLSEKDKKEQSEKGESQDLIHRAKWAKPVRPDLTIYRSQELPCRVLQNMTSETGGQAKLITTVPIFGNRGTGQELLPKGTLVMVKQTGKVGQGSTRLTVTLEQLELPPPYTEVISLKADIGDQDGANGLKGTTDNHTMKIVGATILSAILNIGVRSIASTPGPNQYYQNPGQLAAQDIGQSVQRDAQSIIDRELRIPPTVTIDKNRQDQAFCTVNLLENVQFNRPAIVVR